MEKTRIVFVTVLALLLVVLVKSSVSASGDKNTLKGLKGVNVLIEDMTNDAIKAGLTVKQIQTDVEVKLRIAGIRVLTKEESIKTLGRPYLYVNLNIRKTSNTSLYHANLEIQLIQNVLLERDQSMSCSAATWSISGVASGGKDKIQTVRDFIKDNMDEFINDYLAVNPKK